MNLTKCSPTTCLTNELQVLPDHLCNELHQVLPNHLFTSQGAQMNVL